MDNRFDFEFDEGAVIREMREFLKDSANAYSSDMQRVRDDLVFASGDQWDKNIIGDLRRTKRINKSFNEYDKYVNAIVSPASKSPYHPQLMKPFKEYDAKRLAEIQKRIDDSMNESGYKDELELGMYKQVPTGCGIINLTTEAGDGDFPVKVIIENVRDVSAVAFDPECTRLDMGDATAGAIVNYVGKKRAKVLYRDIEGVGDWNGSGDNAYPAQWSIPQNSVPLVSYYRLSEDSTHVEFFKVCGDRVVEAKILMTTHIPLYKLCGYECYRDNKFTSIGIVAKTKDIQFSENLAFSTLIERLNRSVKAGYICTAEAIDGLEKNISKLSDGDVPLFLYRKGEDKPEPIQEAFQTGDLINVLNASQQMFAATIGVPSVGVQGINNVNTTATGALLQQVNSESNVACFYKGLANVVRQIAETMLEIYTDGNPDSIKIAIESGPATITQNMKRRQELTAMSAFVPDNVKPLVAKYYAESLEDEIGEQLAKDIEANLPPEIKIVKQTEDPTALKALGDMKALLDQATAQIEQLTQQNQELAKQNETLNLSLLDNREARQLDWNKTLLQNETQTHIREAELAMQDKQIALDFVQKQEKLQMEANENLSKVIEDNNDVLYASLPEGAGQEEAIANDQLAIERAQQQQINKNG